MYYGFICIEYNIPKRNYINKRVNNKKKIYQHIATLNLIYIFIYVCVSKAVIEKQRLLWLMQMIVNK